MTVAATPAPSGMNPNSPIQQWLDSLDDEFDPVVRAMIDANPEWTR